MTKNIINKAPEAKMIGKVRGMIDHLYPGIEEKAREIFIHEHESAMKIIRRKVDFRLAFHAWFLLKYEFSSRATAMEMADSFPMDFFNKDDKKMIKNFLNYKESLFEILEISEDKKNYTIRDLLDNNFYLIKTFDLPARFSKEDLIKAIIIKNLDGDYFFYGAVQAYDVANRKEFIKEMLNVIRLENMIKKTMDSSFFGCSRTPHSSECGFNVRDIRKENKGGVIEWEIDKERTSKKEASQE